ncbi:hypothetical protein [Mycetohabitans sp. B46]|uniref:hypothetical protein n=1 Tax=Mycetohabitans sp. B46 TaxID=2772536 RepID=UPI00307E5A86
MQMMLQAMAADGQYSVIRVELLPLAERTLLFQTWHATQQVCDSRTLFHFLNEMSVNRTPGVSHDVATQCSIHYVDSSRF